MGTPEPQKPKETVFVGQLILAAGGTFLLVLLVPITWRWLRKRQRFQYSLGRLILMVFALAVMVGGGTRWHQSVLTWREYALALERCASEMPAHDVTLTRPFYLGKYEITQPQYEAVTGANPSNFVGATNPVDAVSWFDARDFCKKLSATSGETVRLPTEAEWEYACRAGTTTRFYTGDSVADLAKAGWYEGNSGSIQEGSHPVGQKSKNGWGLYDMHGNVWEWCQDGFEANHYGNSPEVDPPARAYGGAHHMLRGGRWNDDSSSCRSAARGSGNSFIRNPGGGFRVVVAARTR
jgi:formylglycine-generating enzyme required for sulfatase activity